MQLLRTIDKDGTIKYYRDGKKTKGGTYEHYLAIGIREGHYSNSVTKTRNGKTYQYCNV